MVKDDHQVFDNELGFIEIFWHENEILSSCKEYDIVRHMKT